MTQLLANNARALLTGSILAADTTLAVEAAKADTFPVANTGTSAVNTAGLNWFKAVLQDNGGNVEIVYVRTRSSGSGIMSNIIRGQEGTTARNFAASSICELRITALDVQNVLAGIFNLTGNVTGNVTGNLTGNVTGNVTGNLFSSPQTLAFSATPTFDASASYDYLFGTMTANVTAVSISNPASGREICIRAKQDATGGRTWTHPTAPAAAKGAGTIGTLPNQVTFIIYKYNLTDTRWEYSMTPINT